MRTFSLRGRRGVLFGAGTLAVLAVAVGAALLPRPDAGETAGPPAPVSHVDTATRACLLTSADPDPTGTWAAMRRLAQESGARLVVQRYVLPPRVKPAAYVDTLVQLRCSTVVTTGTTARDAVASRLAAGQVPGVHFVVVADRPLRGAAHLEPSSVDGGTLGRLVRP
ncbi:hypothetical protein [Streptomyces sp. NPDC005760]|uniref:hypothetical protein n=1 Tax=Streptomyces sp. NPDC005760 TaxID=3156718 RepID=UPI0034096840